jgi:hypothetical protein
LLFFFPPPRFFFSSGACWGGGGGGGGGGRGLKGNITVEKQVLGFIGRGGGGFIILAQD